jgi:predicted transcriptional regulator
MTTLKVGIASCEETKERILAVARDERRVADEPKVWFTSTESFAKVLSASNRGLLRVIAEKAPGSLDELARNHRQGQVQPLAHAADDARLRLDPPRTRRARSHNVQAHA